MGTGKTPAGGLSLVQLGLGLAGPSLSVAVPMPERQRWGGTPVRSQMSLGGWGGRKSWTVGRAVPGEGGHGAWVTVRIRWPGSSPHQPVPGLTFSARLPARGQASAPEHRAWQCPPAVPEEDLGMGASRESRATPSLCSAAASSAPSTRSPGASCGGGKELAVGEALARVAQCPLCRPSLPGPP